MLGKMRIKGLFKTGLAMALAATLCFESSVAYAAEEGGVYEEVSLEEEGWEIVDLPEENTEDGSGDYEEPEEISGAEGSSDSEEYPVEEISEDEYTEDECSENVEEPGEDVTEDPEQEISLEIPAEDITEDTEFVIDTDDISGNDLTAAPYESDGPVKKLYIFCDVDEDSPEALKYNVKYDKNFAITKAVFTLDSKYTSMKLTASQLDKKGYPVYKNPTWKSSDSGIVSVSPNGREVTITAQKKGKATITCFAGDGSKTKTAISIEVKQAATKVQINGSDEALIGKKTKYEASFAPADANCEKVTWSISDKTKIDVSIDAQTGELTVDKSVKANQKIIIIATANDVLGVIGEKKVTLVKNVDITASEGTVIATKAFNDLKEKTELTASVNHGGDVTWTFKNKGVAEITTKGSKAVIKALKPGTITATATSVSDPKKKGKIIIQVVRPVTAIEITGSDEVLIGKTGTFKAVITPGDAGNKQVTWSISRNTEIEGVSINAGSGKLSVDKDVKANQTVTVVATAKDGGGARAEKKVKLVKNVDITISGSTTIATHSFKELKDKTELTAAVNHGGEVKWSFKNKGVADITTKGNKATIEAIKPGTVTATATSVDDPKKKATIEIRVVTPATGLSLTVSKKRNPDYLAEGCKLQFIPVFEGAYGDPSDKKVKWDYDIVGYDVDQKNEKNLSDEAKQKIKDKKYFFKLDNGTVSLDSHDTYEKRVHELWSENKCSNYAIIVKATTTDGSGITTKKLLKKTYRSPYMKLNTKSYIVGVNNTNLFPIWLMNEHGLKGVYAEVKNPEIAWVEVDGSAHVWIHGTKVGKTKCKLTAMDGSGLSLTINIKIVP